MNTKLDDLSDRFRPLACELIARIVEARIQVTIICTRRSHEEQMKCIEMGTSKTLDSKHLTGDAIDLAPTECLAMKNWAPEHPHWKKMGAIGKRLGLTWGGDWGWDFGHFELGHIELKT